MEKTDDLTAIILTDIFGLKDAFGSCDAKFAGDAGSISTFRMNVQLHGISI